MQHHFVRHRVVENITGVSLPRYKVVDRGEEWVCFGRFPEHTYDFTLEFKKMCCYQTSIGNSKDFMNEFGRAYQAIGEAMEDYGKLIPYLERDYPNHKENKTGIGFKQSEL